MDLCNGGNKSASEELHCSNQCQAYWKDWSPWTECSATCGKGNIKRTRQCFSNTSMNAMCFGTNIQYSICFSPPCWTEWAPVSVCNATCDGGTFLRSRKCKGRLSRTAETRACIGNDKEYLPCNTHVRFMWLSTFKVKLNIIILGLPTLGRLVTFFSLFRYMRRGISTQDATMYPRRLRW